MTDMFTIEQCMKIVFSRLGCVNLIIFFFFFQAEDGIRDVAVTGVQTCALPISGSPCEMQYFWQKASDPKPRSFFDTGTDELWYWPLDGFLEDKVLSICLLAVRDRKSVV